MWAPNLVFRHNEGIRGGLHLTVAAYSVLTAETESLCTFGEIAIWLLNTSDNTLS